MSNQTEIDLIDPTLPNPHARSFITAFSRIQAQVHYTAQDKGWWEERNDLVAVARKYGGNDLAYFAEGVIAASQIALEHSEISESLEGIRASEPGAPHPDDKIPAFSMEEAEAADTIIRIMDRAEKRGLRVAEAIIAKAAMNQTRSRKHGGKAL